MEVGASSSCFYPLETEKAFLNIASAGIKTAEIFLNSPSELEKNFIGQLKSIRDCYGVEVTSLHPFRSFSEGYDLFSKYKRRYDDATELFRRYFEAANELNAEYIILHGSRGRIEISNDEYAERYFGLSEIAEKGGCPMKKSLGDSFRMVLDIKQARRAGADVKQFIDAVGENIVHVHLSDCDKERDCIPPSEKGFFDFSELFSNLDKVGYNGRYIVELYSDSFSTVSEIVSSTEYLQNILNSVKEGRL